MFKGRRLATYLKKLESPYTTDNLIEVSKTAILHNLDLFEGLSGLSCIPVLKGNAYGHGIGLVAKALSPRKLPYIAVDGYFEALRIRRVSNQPVLIMGAISSDNYSRIRYDNFAFVVDSESAIHSLGKTNKKVNVHLEINTGMNRYGAKYEEVEKLTKLILTYQNLMLEGVMSHLADSDGDDISTVQSAVKDFDSSVECVKKAGANPTIIHIAQTAGSLRARSKYATTFRLGIGLYGINPFSKEHSEYSTLKDLRPALKLTTRITKIVNLSKGDKVSYNYTYTAPKSMRIGIIPFGYYEGINRSLSNCGVVKVGNKFTPIVGRVCMNHTMISLDNLQAHVGDKVIIYSNDRSDENSIESIASDHDLFSYNLLTTLSSNVRRVLVS